MMPGQNGQLSGQLNEQLNEQINGQLDKGNDAAPQSRNAGMDDRRTADALHMTLTDIAARKQAEEMWAKIFTQTCGAN